MVSGHRIASRWSVPDRAQMRQMIGECGCVSLAVLFRTQVILVGGLRGMVDISEGRYEFVELGRARFVGFEFDQFGESEIIVY